VNQSPIIYRTSSGGYIHAENKRDMILNRETDCKDVKRAVPSKLIYRGLFKKKSKDQRKRD